MLQGLWWVFWVFFRTWESDHFMLACQSLPVCLSGNVVHIIYLIVWVWKTRGLAGVLQLVHYLVSALPTPLFCLHRVQFLLSTNHSDSPHPLVFWGSPVSHLHLSYVWDPSTLHLHWWNGGCHTLSPLPCLSPFVETVMGYGVLPHGTGSPCALWGEIQCNKAELAGCWLTLSEGHCGM